MKFLFTILSLSIFFESVGQLTTEPFAIEIEPLVISNAPGVHSYCYGKTTVGKWVVFGGRVDGLHQRQPFSAFLESDNNKMIYVIDPVSEQVWTADLSVLNASIFEQLQSTNQEFYQIDTTLYTIGGYGYSATIDDHITYPNLTAIDLNGVANAVINNNPINSYFRQITDNRFKVTGGQLGYLDSTFYLVGGQLFDGQYNPMGPDHGPGFTQEYTNAIRTFKIEDDGTNLNVTNYQEIIDTVNLHRRDYNMVKQNFPDGAVGFTAFSGVFNYNDMPYLNTVDIKNGNYIVNNNFNQYLSQYHSANIPIYDSIANCMHTLFFGGISQFYLDNNNNLIEDSEVPFVKTISKVSRFSDGSVQEIAFDYIEMPALVGSGSEFIPSGDYLNEHEMIKVNDIPNSKTLIGYIYGGIESSEENIFFINDGTQSFASNVIFKVYINKSIVGVEEYVLEEPTPLSKKIYPNPATNEVMVEYSVEKQSEVIVEVIDMQGKKVKPSTYEQLDAGVYETTISTSELKAGQYMVNVYNGTYWVKYPFIKK